MGLGDEEFDRLDGIVGEFCISEDVMGYIGAGGTSVEVLEW
jgi:hypothetical protein